MRLGGPIFPGYKDPEQYALAHIKKGYTAAYCPYELKAGQTAENRLFKETMQRIGLPAFIKIMGIDPIPQMVKEPRSNPYVFWAEEEVPGGFERDVQEFRRRHAA